MKKLFAISLFLFATSNFAQAQNNVIQPPAKEYSVSLSENSIKLAPGESKQIMVTLNRSKGFSKSEATLGISSVLPVGVTISYEPAVGVFETSVATITASKETKEGQYQIILRSSLRNITKGSIVKVIVDGNAISKEAVSLN